MTASIQIDAPTHPAPPQLATPPALGTQAPISACRVHTDAGLLGPEQAPQHPHWQQINRFWGRNMLGWVF